MSLTNMDLEEFEEFIENKSIIVLFGSKKCEPCKLADEFLTSFMDFNKNNDKNFKFEYIKLINEEHPDLFIEKGISLKNPLITSYKKLASSAGYKSKSGIKKTLDKLKSYGLIKFEPGKIIGKKRIGSKIWLP